MLAADRRISDTFADNIARLTEGPRTGQLLTAPAPPRAPAGRNRRSSRLTCSLLPLPRSGSAAAHLAAGRRAIALTVQLA
jgi:hypothetical protein